MVDVPAGHEHAFRRQLDVVAADRAAGWLQIVALLLAVLLLDFDDWQLLDGRLLRALLSLSLLRFLLAHPPNHLEEVVAREVRVKVAHEVVRVEVTVLHLHAHELATVEHVHEVAQQVVHQVLNLNTHSAPFLA